MYIDHDIVTKVKGLEVGVVYNKLVSVLLSLSFLSYYQFSVTTSPLLLPVLCYY